MGLIILHCSVASASWFHVGVRFGEAIIRESGSKLDLRFSFSLSFVWLLTGVDSVRFVWWIGGEASPWLSLLSIW